ncbi:acetyltransferase [Frateuria edaphi]|uniref:acetyltransferase n=1 Tax=Frateuria edaphi TaxID=2898793 RepID=UPI003CE45BD4
MSSTRISGISIVGAGGFAREVLFLLDRLGKVAHVRGLYESDNVWKKRRVAGFDVLPLSRLDQSGGELILAIGDPAVRKSLRESLSGNIRYPTLIDPAAIISRCADIGDGVIVCAGAIITTDVVIGHHVHLDRSVNVGHDCHLGHYVTVAPGAVISGNCQIGTSAYIGAAACLRERVSIGERALVGMGAVVVKHVPADKIHAGNPARELPR